MPVIALHPLQGALAKEIASDASTTTTDPLRLDAGGPADGPSRTGAAPAAPTALAPGGETARAIATQIAEALRQGSGTIDVTLSPEELGRVRLSVGVGEGAMLVSISAERPETLDLMRRHIDILHAEARAEGFATLSFAFSDSGGQPPAQAETLATAPERDAPPAPATAARHIPSDGLDLRL